MTTRLQLGASRLEELDSKVLKVFLDKSWIHLGDPEHKKDSFKGNSIFYFFDLFRKYSISYILKESFQKVFNCNNKGFRSKKLEIDKLYSHTNFKEFYYRKRDVLPFDNISIDYIFSELIQMYLYQMQILF